MSGKVLTFRPSKRNENVVSELSELAESENRSLNNYIENLFVRHVKETKKPT